MIFIRNYTIDKTLFNVVKFFIYDILIRAAVLLWMTEYDESIKNLMLKLENFQEIRIYRSNEGTTNYKK